MLTSLISLFLGCANRPLCIIDTYKHEIGEQLQKYKKYGWDLEMIPLNNNYNKSKTFTHVYEILFAKEYVSPLIGLYKNNGSVSCVGINFLLISSLYTLRPQFHTVVSSWCPFIGNSFPCISCLSLHGLHEESTVGG